MAAYAAGDAAAFEALYRRHHAGLYRFIRRLLGPSLASQTDEVFQDSWLRVVHARARWSPQGASFRTWLFTLAHHRVIDVWRKSGREVSLEGDDDNGPWEPDGTAWQHWPAPADECGTAALGHDARDDLPGADLERREQRLHAVPLVLELVAHRRVPRIGGRRMDPLEDLQGLLVDAEHD